MPDDITGNEVACVANRINNRFSQIGGLRSPAHNMISQTAVTYVQIEPPLHAEWHVLKNARTACQTKTGRHLDVYTFHD